VLRNSLWRYKGHKEVIAELTINYLIFTLIQLDKTIALRAFHGQNACPDTINFPFRSEK